MRVKELTESYRVFFWQSYESYESYNIFGARQEALRVRESLRVIELPLSPMDHGPEIIMLRKIGV